MFSTKGLKTNLESASALLVGIFLFINIISSSMLLHISFPIMMIFTSIVTISLLGIKIQLEDSFAEKSQRILFALLSSFMITCLDIKYFFILATFAIFAIIGQIFFAFCLLVDTIFFIIGTSKLMMYISNYEYILYSGFIAALYFKMEIITNLNNMLPMLAQIGANNFIGFLFLIGLALSLNNAINRSFIASVENRDTGTFAFLSIFVDNAIRNKALKIAIEENIPNNIYYICLAKYASKENIEQGITSAIDNHDHSLINYFSASNNITPGIFEKCLNRAIEKNNHSAIRNLAKSPKITEETINKAIVYANKRGDGSCANTITAARQP